MIGKWKKLQVVREKMVQGTACPARVMEAYKGSLGISPLNFILGTVLIARRPNPFRATCISISIPIFIG